MKKSLISVIKKLLTKLGAQEVEGNNLVDVISNGADMITVNKAYVDALAPFIINVIENGGTLTADKTDPQIGDAINNNRQIVVVYSGMKYYCTWAITNPAVKLLAGVSIARGGEDFCDMIGYDARGGWAKYDL